MNVYLCIMVTKESLHDVVNTPICNDSPLIIIAASVNDARDKFIDLNTEKIKSMGGLTKNHMFINKVS